MECYESGSAENLNKADEIRTNLDLAIVAPFRTTTVELNRNLLAVQRVVACWSGLILAFAVVHVLWTTRLASSTLLDKQEPNSLIVMLGHRPYLCLFSRASDANLLPLPTDCQGQKVHDLRCRPHLHQD